MMIQHLNKYNMKQINIKNSIGVGVFNPLEIRVINLLAGGVYNG